MLGNRIRANLCNLTTKSGVRAQNRASEIASISFFVVLSSVLMASQQSQGSADAPVFRTQSSLVLVDVISQAPETGLPVRDFTKESFRLFDNRRELRIATFDAGRYDARPIAVWLVVICNESGLPKFGASSEFFGKESLFRPALDHLATNDSVGIAHWCDNGEARLDLLPTQDRHTAIRALSETLKPIPFQGGVSESDRAGEQAFRKLVRLIIGDAYRRNPKPLPVIVFLHGDHTGQPRRELANLVDDFLETSGIVFGIQDYRAPKSRSMHEQSKIMHYMAIHTGGEYLSSPPSGFAAALETILVQLHFRYELGFIPPAIDNKRHELKVELTNAAKTKHKGVRLKFRPEYIPLNEEPEWVQ